MKILILIFLVAFTVSPLIRCIVHNLGNIYFYGIKDTILYFKERKWEDFDYFGIQMFVGMFGKGKTLSMSHKAQQIYDRFGDRVRFISNYKLNNIPYIPLENFSQLVDLGEEEENYYIGTVVLIDEIENVLSHRNYANFPLPLLHMLTQQRKKKVYILCSAQRFFMVDKIFRSITTNVYDCNKHWRFQNMKLFDAWDYENGINPQLLQAQANIWWFVKNRDYESYDTSQMIQKGDAEKFISNDEVLVRRGLDLMMNEDAIQKPNKKRVRRNNKQAKR